MGALTHTVKGPIASFRSADKAPIESLKFHFLPKQAAGTPSPENPIPIEGWTGLNGYGTGENLLPFDSVISDGYTRTLDGLTATYNNGIVHITGNHTKSGWTNIIDFYSVWQNKNVTLPPGTYNMANCLCVVCKIDDGSYVNKSGEFTVNESAIIQGFYVPVYGEGEKDITVPLILSLGTARPKKYEPYYPIKTIQITFPDGETIYGGYVDPVAGEIVAKYALYETTWGAVSTGTVLGDTKRKGFYVSSIEFANSIDLHNNGQGPYGKYRRTLCNIVPWGWDYNSDYPHYYIHNHDINIMMPVDTPDNTVIQFCAWLKTPIHIPIPAEDMKAFLDHNNFWSDANDDTEVEYCFADRLSERKLIMDTPHIESASDAIVSFSTDMKAPIVDLKAYFTPVQEGTGDPSPQNKRSITGWTGCNIHQEHKNLIDKNALTGTDKVWWKGKVIGGYPNHYATPMIPVKPGGTYYLNRDSGSQDYVCFFDKDGEYIEQQVWNTYAKTKTLGDNVYYVGITLAPNDINTALFQFDSADTSYTDYTEGSIIPVQFPAMKNLVALNYSPYVAQQNPNATIIKQTTDELEFTTHGDYTYECVRLFYMIPAGTYTVKIYATTVDENDNYSPLLALYASGERTPFAGIRNGQSATFTLEENTVVDMRFFGNLDDSLQRTVKFSNFQIERGSVATRYESRATVYGGYIDLIRSKIVSEWKKIILDGTELWENYGDSIEGYSFRLGGYLISDRMLGYQTSKCSMFKNVDGAWSSSYKNEIGIYSDHTTVKPLYFRSPDGVVSTLSEFTQWLSENKPELCYKLAVPIEYDLTPEQIKTLKGLNNIWADTNGNVDVKYWTH